VVLLLTGLALTAAAPAPAFAANVRPGWHEIRRVDSVYVRANPGGFTLGTLFTSAAPIENPHTDRVFVVNGKAVKHEVWGYAAGDVNLCGWFDSAGTLTPTTGGSGPPCAPSGPKKSGYASRVYMTTNYAYKTNDYMPGDLPKPKYPNHGTRVKVTKATSLFGNYDRSTGTFHDRYTGSLHNLLGKTVAWRWETKDRKAVMVDVFNGHHHTWGYIPVGSVPTVDPSAPAH
jgi:hypothetical protein